MTGAHSLIKVNDVRRFSSFCCWKCLFNCFNFKNNDSAQSNMDVVLSIITESEKFNNHIQIILLAVITSFTIIDR